MRQISLQFKITYQQKHREGYNQARNPKLVMSNNAYPGIRLQTARPKRLVQQPDYYRHPQKVVVNNQ